MSIDESLQAKRLSAKIARFSYKSFRDLSFPLAAVMEPLAYAAARRKEISSKILYN